MARAPHDDLAFDFEDYVPFLVRRITPYTESLIANEMELLGIKPEILRIMLMLERHGPQNLSNLADLASINISTLSRLIGRMQKLRLVQRLPSGFGRVVEIRLLPLGQRKINAMIPVMHGLQGQIAGLLGDEDLAIVKASLRQLYAVIQRVAKDHGEALAMPKKVRRSASGRPHAAARSTTKETKSRKQRDQ